MTDIKEDEVDSLVENITHAIRLYPKLKHALQYARNFLDARDKGERTMHSPRTLIDEVLDPALKEADA